jgi:hypothetical protein
MSKNWFEQNMNKKLSGTAEDFDLDANWKAIQAKRSKKKRRVIYFWFVLPAVLILLAGGSLYLSTDQDKLIGQEKSSDKPIPLASGNIESEKIESTTQNEVQSNTDLNSTAIPQTVKNDEKNGLQKHFKTTPQKTQIAQTSQISKTTINLHSEDVRSPKMDSEPIKFNDESVFEKAAFELITNLEILPLDSKLSLLPETAIELQIPLFDLAIESKKTSRQTSGYWIGASAMYGLQSINRSGPENLYASRQAEEETLDMLQAGFEFGVKLNKHFSLQTGLNFIQFTDKRVYQNTEVYSVIDSNFLISKLLKADGNMQDIYGVAEIPYVREINETSYNRYRHMELPLILAWENKLSSKFIFRAGAGVSLGLISSRSGSISDNLNTQIPLSQASYKSQGQLAGLIRIEWMYTKPGWSAGVILQGRSDLTNQLKTAAGYTERRTSYAFGLAYRIHL